MVWLSAWTLVRRDDIHEPFLGLSTCLITRRHAQRLCQDLLGPLDPVPMAVGGGPESPGARRRGYERDARRAGSDGLDHLLGSTGRVTRALRSRADKSSSTSASESTK